MFIPPRIRIPLMGSFAVLFALVGCDDSTPRRADGGTPPPPDVDGGPADPGAGPSDDDYWCCINEQFYDCPDSPAVVRCGGGFDLAGCLEACTPGDFECNDACFDQQNMTTPDPSSCTRDATMDGMCDSAAPATCVADPTAPRCSLDSDCTSHNCTDGRCYPNTNGSLCELDSDCTSNNCTDGCCYSNAVGSPCDLDSDCTSNNCHANRCHGNGAGSGCDLDSDCTSRDCTNNICR